ncbi:MAG: hypothetical protein ACKV22_17360 [Bryobacteraceae bacterium]
MTRPSILLALAMVAGAAMCPSALVAQGPEPSYSLEGAWFGQASFPGAPRPVPFMDIFTPDPNNHGQSGSVLCTLQVGKIQSPMGLVSLTPTGHGNWVRIDKNKFVFTVWRILADADGRPVSTAKFWGTVTVETNDTHSGTMNFEYYDQDGSVFRRNTGTTVRTRIGTSLVADPNPIPVAGNAFLGSTTISWSAPDAQAIEIHIGSPDGPLFASMGNRGSAQTGNWVPDGTTFYLQDVTGGKPLTSANTLATLVVHLQKK